MRSEQQANQTPLLCGVCSARLRVFVIPANTVNQQTATCPNGHVNKLVMKDTLHVRVASDDR